MLALYTLMCPWFCLIFVFAHGKAADHNSFQMTTPNIVYWLRGFHGGGANVYQQPVTGGENILISCSALGRKFTQAFLYLAWSARSPIGNSTMYTDWDFIGGMNSTRHLHIDKPQKNAIDWRGFLSIRNVTKDQNGTEYRCTVKKKVYLAPEASFVELFVVDETASTTPRSHLTSTTDFDGKHSTVDGKWSAWGAWSPCTKTCGTGTSTRERVCNNPVPTHGGEACGGEAYEAQVCSVGHCSTPPTLIPTQLPPVDGKWSAWGAWSPCTKTCGTGTSTRERVCNNPVPAHGGEACRGKVYEAQACSVGHCSNNPGTDSTYKGWTIGLAVVTLFLVLAVITLALQRCGNRRGKPLEGVHYVVNPSNGSKECDSDDDMINP